MRIMSRSKLATNGRSSSGLPKVANMMWTSKNNCRFTWHFSGFFSFNIRDNYLAFRRAFSTKQIWFCLSRLRCWWSRKIGWRECWYHQFCWPFLKTFRPKYECEFDPKCQLHDVHWFLQFWWVLCVQFMKLKLNPCQICIPIGRLMNLQANSARLRVALRSRKGVPSLLDTASIRLPPSWTSSAKAKALYNVLNYIF